MTRSVPDFHLVLGQPARPVACVCRCGEPFLRFESGAPPETERIVCPVCGLPYAVQRGVVVELTPPLAASTPNL